MNTKPTSTHNENNLTVYSIMTHRTIRSMMHYSSASIITLVLKFILVLSQLIESSHQQSSISLNTAQWFVSNANNSIVIPAQVPGGIYSDLRRSNVLKQDILYGKNDLNYRWVGNENWTYTTLFTIDHQIAKSQSVKLVLHGVDTISTVLINGQEIGTTDNMFVRYKFDIKPHLKLAGVQNVLAIRFESPIKYSARRSHQSIRENRGKIIPPYCTSPAQRGECHVNFIRKMQASFSWDWGPAFPSVGIYREIDIEFGSFGMIRNVLVETRRLPPVYHPPTTTPQPPPVLISSSSSLRNQHHFKANSNKTVPYMRAPPYYIPQNGNNNRNHHQQHNPIPEDLINLSKPIESSQQLLEENWLLKITLVAEMVQPSFGYNMRVEFNLDGVLHYESEHINVVANSDGFIRLGFNLRIDQTRLRVKPWWPNNAGNQTMYRLQARIMPIPSPNIPPDISLTARSMNLASKTDLSIADEFVHLQFRNKPHRTPARPAIVFLAAQYDVNRNQVSEKEIMFGFRTVELLQEPVNKGNPEDGLTFNFRINGVDLFAMGTNWIPAGVLPELSNDLEYVRYLLQSAKDANMNMMRVWGGGIYETDEFYKMADEMGIMIWHDFMFACALYPVDEDFLASVRSEIEQQVQRLQHHPSIVLWAGNNENEMAIAGPWWPEVLVWSKKLRESYAKLYVDTIRPIVQILDPTRPYVESSPSNGLLSQSQQYSIARTPNDNKYGDVHHYDYWSDSFDWTNYPSTRFASEYGFQSYPSFNALAAVTAPSDWKYPLTSNILHRQHRLTGEAEIRAQIKSHFKDLDSGGVEKFKNFLYVSQLTQAIAIKTETEFYRRNRFIDPETNLGKTMGALYWQLNDVWAAPTWSSIEYGGKWKMLHYFARRFFFPIQVMPYLIQPPASVSSVLQQALSTGSNFISNLHNRLQNQNDPQLLLIQQQQQQHQTSGHQQMFVVDLVRDDLFHLLDSFNVTIKFYRWTSFTPVFQDTVYVAHTAPQNVTRIYEQDISRILRQSGGTHTLSSGVFQVIIHEQPQIGLSRIDNYLMPVAPARVTAMRFAKITANLIQGPFELSDGLRNPSSSSAQWSCAYRLTLVTDAIAMFVWLDLNLMNVGNNSPNQAASGSHQEVADDVENSLPFSLQPLATPEILHHNLLNPNIRDDSHQQFAPPEHLHLHLNNPHMQDQNRRRRADRQLHQVDGSEPADFAPRLAPQFSPSSSPNVRRNIKPLGGFRPLEGTGSNMLRYQFSDNAFHMFEPSMMVDLYLNRCLGKAQVEAALEIQTLTDTM